MKMTSALAGVLLSAVTSLAHAAPIDVSYTMSGSPEHWLFDFSVTNNLGGSNDLYLFGVRLLVPQVSATPNGWDTLGSSGNWSLYGGSNTEYNARWITCPSASCPIGHPLTAIQAGQTLNGFLVLDGELTPPTEVSWFAVAAGGTYTGPGCAFICGAPHDNPGFEGLAVQVANPVPLPASLALFMGGLGVLGSAASRRKSGIAAG